jgi:peptide/nickel transport system substrate-binding protein
MRRKAVIVAVILSLFAAACGDSDSDSGGTNTTATTTGQVDTNAEVRIAAYEDDWPAGGTGAKSYHFMYTLNTTVYEPLIYLNADYTFRPGLAERWEIQPDGKTTRFFLRKGVTFHNGQPFTAEDVLWTWGVRQPEGKTLSTVANTLGPDSVKKVDDFTVDFTPATPNLRIAEQIVHPEGAIVPKGTHNDTAPYSGSGPFKLVSYTPKQSAVIERNEAYWGEKPKVKKITFQFLPDPQTRLEALKAGQVDFVIDLPPAAAKSVEDDGRFRVVRSAPGRNHLLYVNKLATRVTADKAVREAVNYAIDRKSYVDVVLDGNGEAGRWMAPKSVLGSSADVVKGIERDVNRSKKVLDDAGWKVGADGIREKDGKKLTLRLLGQQEVNESALLVIQSNLKEIGADTVILKTPDLATRSSLYASGKGDFDLDLEPPNQNDGNPAFLPVLRMNQKTPTNVQFAPNADPPTANGPAFEEQVAKAASATKTADVQAASATMMKILSNDDHIVVPLAGAFRIYGMAKNVNLGEPHPSFTNQTWFSLTKSSGS